MLLLEVPLTRPLAFRRRTLLAIYALATLIITIVTLLNVVAVGYELVPFTSDALVRPANPDGLETTCKDL